MSKSSWEQERREMDERERGIVRRIAEALDAYAEGRAYTDGDGDEAILTDLGEDAPEDWEQRWIGDYFDDIYNLRHIVDDELDYRSVRVMVACGGPNVWVDTDSMAVELYWCSDHVSYALLSSTVTEIDDYFREVYEQARYRI